MTAVREPVTLLSLLDWVYRRQLAHLAAGWDRADARCLSGPSYSTDGVAAAARIAALGCHVQGHAGGWTCHPDAEAVHQVAQRYPSVIGYAATGRQPPEPPTDPPRARWREPDRRIDKWCVAQMGGKRIDVLVIENPQAAIELRRVLKRRGRPSVIQGPHPYCPVEWKTVHYPSPYCPIDWEPEPGIIAAMAAERARWLAALDAIHERLRSVSLTKFELVAIGVEASPLGDRQEMTA